MHTQAEPTNAIVSFNATISKFVCTLNGKSIGASKHFDYFEYHYKRGDISSLTGLDIDKFTYLADDGSVKEVKPAQRKVVQAATTITFDTADEPFASNMAGPPATFMNILYPSREQLQATKQFNMKRGRGRPKKEQDGIPAGVTKNVLSDDTPATVKVDGALKHKIKKAYNWLLDNPENTIEEIIQHLMVKFNLPRNIIYNITA